MPTSDRARGGFTLLEVLAAVAILGVLYTVLATAGARGIRAEADSLRRMEASMVADSTLAELEDQWSSGTAPQPGVQQFERDGYAVEVRVADFDLPLPDEPKGSPPGLLRRGGRGAPATSPLRSVDVVVSWQDGDSERTSTRKTFAFDTAAAAAATPAQSGAAQ